MHQWWPDQNLKNDLILSGMKLKPKEIEITVKQTSPTRPAAEASFCGIGSLKNLSFSNIYIETRLRTGYGWGNGEPIHISAIRGKESVKLGSIENVSFNGITCHSAAGILVFATAETIIKNVVFKDIDLEFVDSLLNYVAGWKHRYSRCPVLLLTVFTAPGLSSECPFSVLALESPTSKTC